MKKLILIALLLTAKLANAQEDTVKLASFPYDETHTKIIYEDIIQNNLSKDDLFKNAQSWIAKQFGSYKSVVQFEDKDAGRIICKGSASIINNSSDKLLFTLTIDVKPQKYRCQISEISNHLVYSGGIIDETFEKQVIRYLKRTDPYKQAGYTGLNEQDLRIKSILQSLKSSMIIKDDF